jgi:capsid protein
MAKQKIGVSELKTMIKEEYESQKLVMEYLKEDGTLNEGPFSAFFKTLAGTAGKAASAAGNAVANAANATAGVAGNVANKVVSAVTQKAQSLQKKIGDASAKIAQATQAIKAEYEKNLQAEYKVEFSRKFDELQAKLAADVSKELQNFIPVAQKNNVDPYVATTLVAGMLQNISAKITTVQGE